MSAWPAINAGSEGVKEKKSQWHDRTSANMALWWWFADPIAQLFSIIARKVAASSRLFTQRRLFGRFEITRRERSAQTRRRMKVPGYGGRSLSHVVPSRANACYGYKARTHARGLV